MKLTGAQKALAKEQEEQTTATYDGRDIRLNGRSLDKETAVDVLSIAPTNSPYMNSKLIVAIASPS